MFPKVTLTLDMWTHIAILYLSHVHIQYVIYEVCVYIYINIYIYIFICITSVKHTKHNCVYSPDNRL